MATCFLFGRWHWMRNYNCAYKNIITQWRMTQQDQSQGPVFTVNTCHSNTTVPDNVLVVLRKWCFLRYSPVHLVIWDYCYYCSHAYRISQTVSEQWPAGESSDLKCKQNTLALCSSGSSLWLKLRVSTWPRTGWHSPGHCMHNVIKWTFHERLHTTEVKSPHAAQIPSRL